MGDVSAKRWWRNRARGLLLPDWITLIDEDAVMNTSDLLEQLLRAGQGSMSQRGAGGASAQGGLGDLGGVQVDHGRVAEHHHGVPPIIQERLF